MKIDPATLSDSAPITAILNDAILNTTAVWYDQPKAEADMTAWLESRTLSGLPVLVARESGAVLGYASYGPFRPWPGYSQTVEHSVYVSAAARGQGVGTALLRSLMDEARAARIHVMIAGIEAENTASLAVHRRLGFLETGRLPEVGRKFDRWLTLVFLQKTLS